MIEPLRDLLGRLGDATIATVQAIIDALLGRRITHTEAVDAIAATIAAANARAYVLADLDLARALSDLSGMHVPPAGLLPPANDDERLTKAATTLLDVLPDTPDPDARVARLARSEPLTAAQEARGEGIRRSDLATGWTRHVTDDCQLCTWWARNGRVWPAEHPMPTHPGCRCTQTPVTIAGPIDPVTTRTGRTLA